MRREQVFWGWGEPGAGPSLPEHADALLREELGIRGRRDRLAGRPGGRRLPPPALPDGLRETLEQYAEVRDDRLARVLRCRGKSYLDLLAQRAGDCSSAPDAVVAPGDAAGVAAVLQACAEAGVAVVPFGGGTSVVGGLAGERGPFAALISLDLGRLDRVIDGRPAVAARGLRARHPAARGRTRRCAPTGSTLGHVPQSYEWATVGGCAATRSAGQTSTGHGRFDKQVVALECVTPAGSLATLDVPGTAAGPALRELVLGSEGTLGVITRVAVRVRRRVEATYDGWSVGSFLEGAELLRALEQDGLAPDIARLVRRGGDAPQPGAGGDRARWAGGCSTGAACSSAAGRARTAARRRRASSCAAARCRWGRSPGHAWAKSRFAGPHLRDDLMDRGVLVETVETATSWSNLERLYGAVRARAAGLPRRLPRLAPLSDRRVAVLHVLGRQTGRPGGAVAGGQGRGHAGDRRAGGTITHHHAVGRDHAPCLRRGDRRARPRAAARR